MKHNHLIGAFISTTALFLLLSCSGGEDRSEPAPTPGTTLRIDIDRAEELTVCGVPEANDLTLHISSKSAWSIYLGSQSEWIEPSLTVGTGNGTVRFRIDENRTSDRRIATIRLTNDAASATVVYEQNAYPPSDLSVEPQRIEVESKAATRTLTLRSDGEWRLSCDNAFCTASPVQGGRGEHRIDLLIGENATEEERTAHITVRSGYESATVTLTQHRKKPTLHIDRGIRTLDDLCRFRDAVNAGGNLSEWKYNGEINLLNDIDLSYLDNWMPIGTEAHPFSEIFNGNGFTIDRLTIASSAYSIGFFGFCIGGTIKNLNIAHADIRRLNPTPNVGGTGGICGNLGADENGPGKIVHCTYEGFGGGICGNVYLDRGDAFITDCTNRSITGGFPGTYGQHRLTISGCRQEGIRNTDSTPFPPADHITYTDCIDNGYVAPVETIVRGETPRPRSVEEFIRSAANLDTLALKHHPLYESSDFNEKFLDAIRNNAIAALEYTNDAGRDPLDFAAYFPELKTLSVRSNNQSGYGGRSLRLDLNRLEKLEFFSCDVRQLSELETDGCTHLKVAKIVLGNESDVTSLDLSRTRIGDSDAEYPLTILCGKMRILYLKTGWKIRGINVDRSEDYISENIDILYKG